MVHVFRLVVLFLGLLIGSTFSKTQAANFHRCPTVKSIVGEPTATASAASDTSCCKVDIDCVYSNWPFADLPKIRRHSGMYCELDRTKVVNCDRKFDGVDVMVSDQAILFPSPTGWDSADSHDLQGIVALRQSLGHDTRLAGGLHVPVMSNYFEFVATNSDERQVSLA